MPNVDASMDARTAIVDPAEDAPAEPPGRRGDTDRGSASLWSLTVGLVLIAIAGVGASIGAALVNRHQARVAADLGALAGAMHAARDSAAACGRAAAVVEANGARLVRCTVDGLVDVRVTVEVATQAPLPMTMLPTARASARAGLVRG